MSWLRKVARVASKVTKIPGVKIAARAIPFVGTGMAIYEGAQLANDLSGGRLSSAVFGGGGGGGGGLPAFPANSTLTPAMQASVAKSLQIMGKTSAPGLLPKGVGGKLQMPWSDPNIPAYLKQFAIDDAYLKQAVRAPRGYVVMRDNEGRPFGVNKAIAQSLRLWKAKKKPPISVRDWEALKRANTTVKKLKRVVKMSKAVSMPTTTRRRTPAKCAA